MEKLLRGTRFISGVSIVGLLLFVVIINVFTNYNASINISDISKMLFRISFILFSSNMMITIILDSKFNSKSTSSANRAEKRRVA